MGDATFCRVGFDSQLGKSSDTEVCLAGIKLGSGQGITALARLVPKGGLHKCKSSPFEAQG